jgi:glycosyltransferase A (GT-A) superfamily protein (DUF2064 family)
VDWSTPQVLTQTRQRLASAGLRHAELPAVADIDTPDDLVHWRDVANLHDLGAVACAPNLRSRP